VVLRLVGPGVGALRLVGPGVVSAGTTTAIEPSRRSTTSPAAVAGCSVVAIASAAAVARIVVEILT
jgi:hypothetical protein